MCTMKLVEVSNLASNLWCCCLRAARLQPRKGCFEVRSTDGKTYVSLLVSKPPGDYTVMYAASCVTAGRTRDRSTLPSFP